MIILLFIISFALLAVFKTPWAWIGFVLLVLLKWRTWYRYNGRPWRKIHFNGMILFSGAVAKEQIRSNTNNEEFNIENAYIEMVNLFLQSGVIIFEDPKIFIDRQLEIFGSHQDQSSVVDYLIEKKEVDPIKALTSTVNYFSSQDLNDSYFKIRAIIAGIIECHYSSYDRGEYLLAIMTGDAR